MVNIKSATFIPRHVRQRPHKSGYDAYKIKQTRKLVEETLPELTSQCAPFFELETLVFPGTQKSPESLFLRKSLSIPELPSAQPPTLKRPVKHVGDDCTHNLVLFKNLMKDMK